MPPPTSTHTILSKRPTQGIIPGETFTHITAPTPTASQLRDGQLLLESLYLSIDPAMRGWLNDRRSYLPPVKLNAVMRGNTISRVLASKSAKARAGDVVVASTGWREYSIVDEKHVDDPISLPKGAKESDLLGALGMTALTAYFGLKEHGEIKKGDTVVVSGAAGATGSVACQIARIMGAGKVVGIAGSEEKCEWLRELGVDVALSYRDPEFRGKFKEATPEYVDVFFDNVGGDILDTVLLRAAKDARFVMCGSISQYNAGKDAKGPRNIFNVVAQRIKMHGFIIFDYHKEFAEGRKQLAQWISEGKLKSKTYIVKGGLRAADRALIELFEGKNTGKMLVEIKNPEEQAKL